MVVRSLQRGPFWVALAVLLLAGVSGATGSPASSGVPSPTHLGSPSVSAATELLPPSLQAPWGQRTGFDASVLPEVQALGPATDVIPVVVTLWPRNMSLFATPAVGSAPLSPQGVADRFAITASQYADLETYFGSFRLTVTHSWADRLAISLSGPAADVSKAFGTTLLSGNWQGRSVQYLSAAPVLPASIEPEIAAISGLQSGFTSETIPYLPVPSAEDPTPSEAALQGTTTSMIYPSDARNAYGISDLINASGTPRYASGIGVAVVLWGDGYDPSDLTTFFANYYGSELPPPIVQAYPVDGASPPSASSVNDPGRAPTELTLDIEWSASMAPGATIDAVYGPNGQNSSDDYSPTDASLEDALNTAVTNISGVRVISMSFGGDDGQDPSFQAAFSTSFAAATNEGITLLAASGDNGGDESASCSGPADPQFPASSPQVIAVGGTRPTLAVNGAGQAETIQNESAWSESGGGFSTVYSAPSWQEVGSAAAPISANGHRGIPDVAGPAADNFFYFSGQTEFGQGTSFAAPMWAGMIAEMDAIHGSSLGFLTPRFYAINAGNGSTGSSGGLIDISDGSNCVAPAVPGWDAVTGWGSPRALRLYEEITSTFVQLNLTTSASNAAPGSSVSATVTVLNSTSHQPIAGLTVNFILQAEGFTGPCGGTLSSASGTTNATGSAVVSLGVPGCYIGSKASLSATLFSDGYFGENSTSIGINLLGFAGFLAFIQQFPYNVFAFVLIMVVAISVGVLIGRRRQRRRAAREPVLPPAMGAGPSDSPYDGTVPPQEPPYASYPPASPPQYPPPPYSPPPYPPYEPPSPPPGSPPPGA
jgi:kumamolisin